MTDWNKIVKDNELADAYRIRKSEYIFVKVNNQDIDKYQKHGYEIISANSKKTTLRAKKNFFDIFENEVWQIFYKMGFTSLNKENDFKIELNGNSKQLDVVAIDDETIIVVECKSSETIDKCKSFKQELESIKGNLDEIRSLFKNKFPKKKFKYILATRNCDIEEDSNDMRRIKEMDISYFNYDTVLYYRDLTEHLGSAAKYQLLGNIFQKVKIQGIENRVPAIQGSMGGLTYYTFLIEPDKLLKLAYILHRHNANISNFPTYQRIVKKDRLKAIREFVNQGGFFPNSLICSIDGSIKFEKSGQEIPNSISRTGILYLPQTFMSMYIIDGQHRLYGYSDSKYSKNNVIPVVAFINMDKSDQVKMFMDINENQKAVSKSLRNTLNVDLLWDSTKAKERQEALMIKIAEALGEDKDSPLYGRILTGEESKTETRCITTEVIKNALKDSKFLNTYDKESVKYRGTFDKDNNTDTYSFLLPFIKKSLEEIKKSNESEWSKGSSGNTTINNTIYAFIRIIDDIISIKLKEKYIPTAPSDIFEICLPLIRNFASIFSQIEPEVYQSLKQYGEGGKKKAWRALQVMFNSKESEFINDDLLQYLDSISTKNNAETQLIIEKLENYFKSLIKENVSTSSNWAQTVGQQVSKKMFDAKSYHDHRDALDGVITNFDMWDVISFDEIIQIIRNGSNWSSFMNKLLTNDSFQNNKTDTIDWLELLSNSKKKIENNQPVITKDFLKIKEIYFAFGGKDYQTNN